MGNILKNDEIIKELIFKQKIKTYGLLNSYRENYKKIAKEIKKIKLLLSVTQGKQFYDYRDEKTKELRKLKFELNFTQGLISYYKKAFRACCSWIDKSTKK